MSIKIENIETYKEKGKFAGGITISATNNFNIDKLLEMIINVLPNGPMYYPEDQLLDQPERFVVSEIIREKVLLNTDEEVPHSVAITIERFKEQSDKVEIYATIVVERLSQKKIVIGKNVSGDFHLFCLRLVVYWNKAALKFVMVFVHFLQYHLAVGRNFQLAITNHLLGTVKYPGNEFITVVETVKSFQ